MKTGTATSNVVLGVLLLVGSARAAEDPAIDQLRTDVRALEREVRELSRRLDQLQPPRRTAAATEGVTRRSTAPDPFPGVWLNPDRWDKVTTGMTAQQVILVLGTPVSLRPGNAPGSQTLFYTLPIGDTGFLTGTVKLQDDKVAEIRRPELRQVGK